MLQREQAIRDNIIHDEDHERNRRKLDGLYGRVAEAQNRLIVSHCAGRRVLDVGAGYGNLTRAALDAGMDCVGIEIDEEKIARAKEWFGVELQRRDIHDSGFAAGEFDTVIFREVVRHLRLDDALAEAARIAAGRVLIFQANAVWLLRLANRLAGHREHAEYLPADLVAAVERAGFRRRAVVYSDPLAFCLSGGYIGPQLTPRWRRLYRLLLGLDRLLRPLLQALGLARHTCYRVLIVADKQGAANTASPVTSATSSPGSSP